MTDAQLEGKFHGLTDAVLGAAPTNALLAQCWKLGELPTLDTLLSLTHPA
jgi:hypothetical protein